MTKRGRRVCPWATTRGDPACDSGGTAGRGRFTDMAGPRGDLGAQGRRNSSEGRTLTAGSVVLAAERLSPGYRDESVHPHAAQGFRATAERDVTSCFRSTGGRVV
ncbi:hypothetical protein GCM10009675_39140 [Prauserella alba]|uniref:Uncharacterized protein n=1 Tax=Prauserella alba TaxID=176898 RepID=A0ABP4G605_9PSEU